jgi:hypothetical protein
MDEPCLHVIFLPDWRVIGLVPAWMPLWIVNPFGGLAQLGRAQRVAHAFGLRCDEVAAGSAQGCADLRTGQPGAARSRRLIRWRRR